MNNNFAKCSVLMFSSVVHLYFGKNISNIESKITLQFNLRECEICILHSMLFTFKFYLNIKSI